MPALFKYDCIVIGGGAAGLMCAIEAGKRGRRVAVLEKSEAIGKKILISGGGRCNFTNIHCTPANYLSANPHFATSALSRYTPWHFIELVERYNISYHEKTLGQQFCDGSSRQIVGLLKQECDEYNVKIFLNIDILNIAQSSSYCLETSTGSFQSETLVVASGGLSIPKMGATGFGYSIAQQFQLPLIQCRPGLVPLTVASDQREQYAALSGTAFMTTATCNARTFKESFLFTHRGVSGPVVLQISSYWDSGDEIVFNLLPDVALAEEFLARKARHERVELKTVLGGFFSKKFADALVEQLGSNRPISEYADKDLRKFAERIHQWRFRPAGTEGYPKAEVTLGGVDTNNLSSKTMEAKTASGLFFIGEVVDVTGHLGGFNFQWAWASGHAAGENC